MNAEEITNLASLAAISINDDQTAQFAQEFAEILEYVQTIQSQEAGQFEAPKYHTETLRTDSPASVFPENVADRILNQAPAETDRYFQVQAVLKK